MNVMVNPTVGHTPNIVKSKEEMRFILSGPNYLCMGPTLTFLQVLHVSSIATSRDGDKYPIIRKRRRLDPLKTRIGNLFLNPSAKWV